MKIIRDKKFFAIALSVALHALVIFFAGNFNFASKPEAPKAEKEIVFIDLMPAPQERAAPAPPALASITTPDSQAPQAPSETVVPPQAADYQPASMQAPPAPTAQEWALAAKYTLKNSKRYRYTWGQQVRSMMGSAGEGPEQGIVRFRVEIAPDGTLAKLETLWTTSVVAEQLARKAIENLPPLPPTPAGKPLIFERTISFQPFDSGWPPIYKNDCLPDPPAFRNPFAWDGTSPQVGAAPTRIEKADPKIIEECLKQLSEDSMEAEAADAQRQLDQWGSSRLD